MIYRLKIFLIFLSFGITICFINRELYEEIKSQATFEILEYEQLKEIFGNQTTADHQLHLGDENYMITPELRSHLELQKTFLESKPRVNAITLPTEYDIRKARPECLTPIKSQKVCGCCFSFATAAALETRFCLMTNGKLKPELSNQDIVNCDNNNSKCNGGSLYDAWQFFENTGICDWQCQPYVSSYGFVPKCTNTCVDPNVEYYKWKAKKNTFLAIDDPQKIKADIYLNGPVTSGMDTWEDFATYRGGIYVHKVGRPTDPHAVALIGWGYDHIARKEYWIVRNSWGDSWGENGYFKVHFGNYGVDEVVCASQPLF